MIVSRYVNSLKYDAEQSFIWSSVFGNPMLTDAELVKFLQEKRATKISAEEISEKFGLSDEETDEIIQELFDSYLLIEDVKKEDQIVTQLFKKHNPLGKNKVRSLSLIMSEECNFRCKYCIHFANSNHQHNPEKFMSEDIAKKAIDQYLEMAEANQIDEAYINFGGGEPLLNWKTISVILDYIEEQRQKVSMPIKLGINTNLSLMTGEIATELISHNVEVAASLDGFSPEGNDSVRLSKSLMGTYDKIINGFRILEALGRPLNGFAMTVTEDNFADVSEELIDWAASQHMTEVRIDIDVVGMVSLSVMEIVNKLTAIRKYARERNIAVIGFWSRAAENMGLDAEIDDIGFCGGERGNSLCVAPSGQVFPCGYSNYELCKVNNMPDVASAPTYKALLKKRNLLKLENCRDCSIFGFCRGGCLITQEANKNFDSEKIKRMCKLYRLMTYSILYESAEADLI